MWGSGHALQGTWPVPGTGGCCLGLLSRRTLQGLCLVNSWSLDRKVKVRTYAWNLSKVQVPPGTDCQTQPPEDWMPFKYYSLVPPCSHLWAKRVLSNIHGSDGLGKNETLTCSWLFCTTTLMLLNTLSYPVNSRDQCILHPPNVYYMYQSPKHNHLSQCSTTTQQIPALYPTLIFLSVTANKVLSACS